jgi:hypothetical protein
MARARARYAALATTPRQSAWSSALSVLRAKLQQLLNCLPVPSAPLASSARLLAAHVSTVKPASMRKTPKAVPATDATPEPLAASVLIPALRARLVSTRLSRAPQRAPSAPLAQRAMPKLLGVSRVPPATVHPPRASRVASALPVPIPAPVVPSAVIAHQARSLAPLLLPPVRLARPANSPPLLPAANAPIATRASIRRVLDRTAACHAQRAS